MKTVEIPDNQALELESIAATQQKSLQEFALERLSSLTNAANSPQAILRVIDSYPIRVRQP